MNLYILNLSLSSFSSVFNFEDSWTLVPFGIDLQKDGLVFNHLNVGSSPNDNLQVNALVIDDPQQSVVKHFDLSVSLKNQLFAVYLLNALWVTSIVIELYFSGFLYYFKAYILFFYISVYLSRRRDTSSFLLIVISLMQSVRLGF